MRLVSGGIVGESLRAPPSWVALRKPCNGAISRPPLKSTGWTKGVHNSAGNLLLGDGSVPQVNAVRMREQFRAAALAGTNDLDFFWPLT